MRDRDLAALAQREVEGQPLASVLAASRVNVKRSPVTGFSSVSAHAHAPARRGARTRRSRAAPGRARAARRPAAAALRPSSTSPNRKTDELAPGSAARGRRRTPSSGIGVNAHAAPGRGGDLRDRLVEAQRARAGELVDLAVVPVLRQRGDRDVGDVLGVHERLGHVAARAGRPRRRARVGQEVLAEVLREPAAAHDRPLASPAAASRCSARCASGSPRPESSTSRRTPHATRPAARTRRRSPARPGPRGRGSRRRRPRRRRPARGPRSSRRSSRSRWRASARTGTSARRSRSTMRRPVLPVPPRTSVVHVIGIELGRSVDDP